MCPHPAASLITLTSSTRFRPDAYPILMFTSFVHDHLSEIAAAAGANGLISKLASSDAVIQALEELLSRSA